MAFLDSIRAVFRGVGRGVGNGLFDRNVPRPVEGAPVGYPVHDGITEFFPRKGLEKGTAIPSRAHVNAYSKRVSL